jgi:type II secretory pathway pseudopilin PulG
LAATRRLNLLSRKPTSVGFTMIEMIGVLAVLAILATIIISATPRQLDIAAGNLESTNLVNYANALQNSILRNRYIPGTSDVTNAIATELGMDVKDVSINARYNTRAFLFDPDFQFYTNRDLTTPLVHGGQPWQQNIGGAFLVPAGGAYGAGSNNPPQKPRIIILSSLTKALPSGLGTMTANDFDQIWGAADGTVPGAAPFSTWTGAGDDLKIQRLNLGPLFVHLILYNYNAPSPGLGQYTTDSDRPGATIMQVTNSNYGVDTYFLRGTMLGLLKSTNLSSTLDSNQILTRDTSFAYVQDIWRSSINLGEGIDPNAALFGKSLWAVAQTFQASPYNTNAVGAPKVTPPTVVTNIFLYMSNYVNWAALGFPYGNNIATSPSNVTRAAQNAMVLSLYNLTGSPTIAQNNMVLVESGCTTNSP